KKRKGCHPVGWNRAPVSKQQEHTHCHERQHGQNNHKKRRSASKDDVVVDTMKERRSKPGNPKKAIATTTSQHETPGSSKKEVSRCRERDPQERKPSRALRIGKKQ